MVNLYLKAIGTLPWSQIDKVVPNMVKPNTFYNTFYNESQSNLPPTPPDGLIESGETLSLNEIWFRIYVFSEIYSQQKSPSLHCIWKHDINGRLKANWSP